jgi:simple sugar transport system ATP-binding protein
VVTVAAHNEPALVVKSVSKSFGAVAALESVSLELHHGEILGIVGDNGAGKSTLIRCIAGIHRPDAGEIIVRGVSQRELRAEKARELGVETVHQGLAMCELLDVAQNFFLNRELVRGGSPLRRLGWLNRRAMYRETASVLDSLGLSIDPTRPVSKLSGGQRQMVAVARAITWGNEIVLMDEPAAALGVRQSAQVLQFVRVLAGRGVAVIFISHNMQHVLQATDRIVVLRHGAKVGDLETSRTKASELVSLITGADLVVPGQELGV